MFNPWLIIGVIALCAVSFLSGIKVESDHGKAQLLAQEQAMHDAYVKQSDKLRGNADEVSAELGDAEAKLLRDRETYERKLQEAKRANQLGKCEPTKGADGKPGAPVVSVNAGLWDNAIKADVSATGNPGSANAGAASAGPTFATLDAAYANLGENGSRWQTCRDQVKGWQSLAIKNGWVKPKGKSP